MSWRWGERRMFTYVDPRKLQSANPGYCFKDRQAGTDTGEWPEDLRVQEFPRAA